MYKRQPLRNAFEVSFGVIKYKRTIILELTDQDGNCGYSECSAFDVPFYNEEFRSGAWDLLKEQLLPKVVGHDINHPDDIYLSLIHISSKCLLKGLVVELEPHPNNVNNEPNS